jgi:hypothetical protein
MNETVRRARRAAAATRATAALGALGVDGVAERTMLVRRPYRSAGGQELLSPRRRQR